MSDLELFQEAQARCITLSAENPDVSVLKSLELQLAFLIDLVQGKRFDTEKLADLTIGVITAREIEDRDPLLADTLYSILDRVEALRFRR